MANITRSSNIGVDALSAMRAPVVNLPAGEDIDAVSPVYISASGTLLMSKQAQKTNFETDVIGVTPKAFKSGEMAVAFGLGAQFSYSTGLTIGSYLYTSASAGYLNTVALSTTSGSTTIPDRPVAICVSETDIVVLR